MNQLLQSTGSAITGPPLEETAFKRIASIAHMEAGLAIAPGKAAMVRTRLARRLRALKLDSYDAYCELVASDAGRVERREMISALTTNVSHFFREDHHFDRMKSEVLPDLLDKAKNGGRVRIWSAGCSNGQEPYSIAMTILEMANLPETADLRILATDIDPKVISFARQGIYDQRMMAGLPADMRDKYFSHSASGPGQWAVSDALKKLVVFRELNLLQKWPMRGSFDVILCRNVVIYFDADTQTRLWHSFSNAMHPDSWLFLGHSERVSDCCMHLFSNRGVTAYQRTDGLHSPVASSNAHS